MTRAIQIRAPTLFEDDVGRHLEKEVAEEEDAGAEAEYRGGETESLFIVSEAKPMFTRSMKATKYSSI